MGNNQLLIRFYKWIVTIGRNTPFAKSKIVYEINTYFRKKLKPDFVCSSYHPYKIYLDEVDSLHLTTNKEWQKEETIKIISNVKSGDVVIDIGANIGYYTLLFSWIVGKEGKVYAFEPDNITFKTLKKNIEMNNIKNVILDNRAVMDKGGIISFYIDKNNRSISRVHKGLNDMHEIKVKSVSLDKTGIKKADFIKMDAEGAEGIAYKGMLNLIKSSDNLIMFTECTPRNFLGDTEDFINTLNKSFVVERSGDYNLICRKRKNE